MKTEREYYNTMLERLYEAVEYHEALGNEEVREEYRKAYTNYFYKLYRINEMVYRR